MRLARYHGLGNDYLVLCEGGALDAPMVRAVCDRHTGVGGDGILEPFATDAADLGIRIWNPDGSIAEKSGNGLRIAARWAVDDGRLATRRFTISTGFDVVTADVGPDEIVVDMGRVSFEPADIGLGSDTPWIEHELVLGGDVVRATAVSVGNPHCVVFVDGVVDLDTTPWRRWGEAIETHEAFANRTNVQIARVDAGQNLQARVWERGAGPTQASGSSACAVAAAAVRTQRTEFGEHRVSMPGGTLRVVVHRNGQLRLAGPVSRICTVDVDLTWIERVQT